MKNKRIIKYLFIWIFSIIFIISIIKIYQYIIDGKENKKILDELSDYIVIDNSKNELDNDKINIDFNSIMKKNSDTVGFLKVNGTDIEYFVVQAKNNDYYLTHNFDKEANSAGWIFADYRNKFDGTDKNIIIYGHNMRNASMFGTLKNILNRDWQENIENRYITFISKNESSTYEVFSVYQTESEEYYLKSDFNNEEFQSFINKVKSRSAYNFNVDVNDSNQILTLSTCANNNKYRVVLHAKKLD